MDVAMAVRRRSINRNKEEPELPSSTCLSLLLQARGLKVRVLVEVVEDASTYEESIRYYKCTTAVTTKVK
ncbi:hypothetical protein CPC08DRAFT_385479 [Agrocybe pediades]|nr:hypothetical protein CPC08DRAFT_385479 [Agrocybe pediades]